MGKRLWSGGVAGMFLLGLAACSSDGDGSGAASSGGASGTGGSAGGDVAIDEQGRIVVAGSSRVGDEITGDRYGVVARILP